MRTTHRLESRLSLTVFSSLLPRAQDARGCVIIVRTNSAHSITISRMVSVPIRQEGVSAILLLERPIPVALRKEASCSRQNEIQALLDEILFLSIEL